MSLRDALLKAGAVSKKQKQRTERELKRARKQSQGQLDRKKVLQRQAAERKRAELEAKNAERLARRMALRERSEAEATELRVRHLLKHHAVDVKGGPVRFHYVSRESGEHGLRIGRVDLSWSLGRGLRSGQFALALLQHSWSEPEVVLIPRTIIDKLRPEDLVMFNADGFDAEDPALRWDGEREPV